MNSIPLLTLILIICASLPQIATAIDKPVDLDKGEGAVVFRMDSNYPNIPGNKLRVVFKKPDSLEFDSILAQRKGKITVAKLPAGQYRLLKFETLQYETNVEGETTFTVEEGKATYLGDIDFKVNLGYGRDWRVETFKINDNSEKTLAELSTVFSGETISFLLDINWEAENSGNVEYSHFKPVKKDYKGEGLQENGLLAIHLASKRTNDFMKAASLGLGTQEVSRIEFDFKSTDGSNRFGTIAYTGYNIMTGVAYKKLDKYTKGSLIMLELPPGHYSINKFRAHFDDANAAIDSYYNTIDTALPFSIEAGKISYLGEVYGNALTKKILLFDIPQSVNFYINDFWERDQKELLKLYPFLKDIPAETSLLEGKDGWDQIFIQNIDPRASLMK